MINILFVCTGNICRSPLAEGILRHQLDEAGIPAFIDSCGFEAFHVGDPPDYRARAVAERHGVNISGLRARLFSVMDFDWFDRIFVMDEGHYRTVMKLARNEADRSKVDYMLNVLTPGKNMGVMDPWYHHEAAFEKVFQQLDMACGELTRQLRTSTPGI